MSKGPIIPNFQLYGTAETTGTSLFFDLVHLVQTDEQATYGTAPHRHTHLHELVWLTKGCAQVSIDEVVHELGPDTCCLITAGTVHASHATGLLDGFVVHFSTDFLLSAETAAAGAFPLADLAGKTPLAVLTAPTAARLRELLVRLAAEFAAVGPQRNELLRHYLSIVLLEMQREAGLAQAVHRDQASRVVLGRFMALVDQHYVTKKQVSDYADLLSITPNYLNVLIKHTTGRTAGQVIRDRVILEAKRRLLFTTATVTEVAHALHYDDVSYFWRLFKKAVGLSPAEFKKRNSSA